LLGVINNYTAGRHSMCIKKKKGKKGVRGKGEKKKGKKGKGKKEARNS